MVEQIDSEHYEAWSTNNAGTQLEMSEEFYQKPVMTRTWYHTGAFLDRERILTQFADEYWHEEYNRRFPDTPLTVTEPELIDARITAADKIDDQQIINRLNGDEWREVLRACKGIVLRQEVFSLDAPESGASDDELKKQLKPYSVATHNCNIQLLQPRDENQYGVFLVTESEAITFQYERDETDPRIAHTLNTQFDDLGNVLEAASVVYPRLQVNVSLPQATRDEQGKTLIAYAQSVFAREANGEFDIDTPETYRLRLPFESKFFEITALPKAGALYQLKDFDDVLENATTSIEYHISPTGGNPQRRLIEHVRSLYLRDDLTGPLPPGIMESRGFPYESYQLAYTPALLQELFGNKIPDPAATMGEGRYTNIVDDVNWWIRSGTTQFIDSANGEDVSNAQARFYSPISFTDPFGAKTSVVYDTETFNGAVRNSDGYYLTIRETTDGLQNRVSVEAFDYRILSPRKMRDINDNLSEVMVDELGLVKAVALLGKDLDGDGIPELEIADDLEGLEDITENEDADIQAFFETGDSIELESIGRDLLKHSTSRFVYDFETYRTSGKPVVVAAIIRETHHAHLSQGEETKLQFGFEYSDGLGNVAMAKSQAEPGVAKKATVQADGTYTVSNVDTAAMNPPRLRWIGNGRTVLNNKGNPVKQYEPYFSVTPHYEDAKELVETGVTPVLYYDSLGRLIKTELPDNTFSRVEFDSWKQTGYDQNDTVMDSDWYNDRFNNLIDAELNDAGKDPAREKVAAEKAAKHHNTPSTIHFDTLGRPILSIEHNRDTNDNDLFYNTTVELDIEGNARKLIDARGNTVMEYKYDMLGHRVYQNSMDGGQRWLLTNILGNPLRTWDERNHEFQHFYDVLHRPTHSKVLGGDGDTLLDNVFDRVFYGEAEVNPELKNLRGQVLKYYDSGGLIETPEYDFKGQPLATTRKLFKNYKSVVNWVDANLTSDLEADSYVFIMETDALGRITKQTAPDGSIIIPSYNEAGLLNGESVTHVSPTITTIYIKDIDYNEKGQRSKITYGNDVTTQYFYDVETFRLKQLKTKRQNNDLLQNLLYTYDPVGNITEIVDKAIPVSFFDNQKIEGVSTYTYDPLYRLVEATGRENNAPLSFDNKDNWNDSSFMHQINPGDPMAMRNYTQNYQYDAVGNILEMNHNAANNQWTREYSYQTANNRLISTEVGTNTYTYPHHAQHGFMTAMPHLEEMGWNFKEELVKTIKQKVNPANGTAETTYYQYDGAGQRIRKITENQASVGNTPTKKEERIYITGYELYKKHSGADAGLERISLSLMDEEHRFVMIETRNEVDDGTEKRLIRYQLHNHLGSACLELEGSNDAKVISYEEYHPYGTTAYQVKNREIKSAAKRYRYTGMERDEESGLSYHSARYYLPWLGRWGSSDQAGLVDGLNLYGYVSGNPLGMTDPSGKNGKPIWDFSDLNDLIEEVSQSIGNKLDDMRPILQPLAEPMSKKEARKHADKQSKAYRKAEGMNQGATVQASHKAASRNASESGISREDWDKQSMHQHHSRKGKGLDVKATDAKKTKIRTRHTMFEKFIDDAVLRVKKASAGKLTPRGHLDAGAEASWRTQNAPMDQRDIDAIRKSGPALPDKGSPVDPKTGRVINKVPEVPNTPKGPTIAGHNAPETPDTPRVRGRRRGGGIVGKIFSLGVGAYVYFSTGSAWAAAQTANPLPNTTEEYFNDNDLLIPFLMDLQDWTSPTPVPREERITQEKAAEFCGRDIFCRQAFLQGF